MTTLTERMNRLPTARRKKVEKRAKALIAEEMSLQDLRKARKQTQVRVAKALGIKQENVSRLEKRSDLLLSTLSGYVEAMGGKLSLVAEFPDRPPVALTGIAALDQENPPAKSWPAPAPVVSVVALALVTFQCFEKRPIRQVGGFRHIVPLYGVAVSAPFPSLTRRQRPVRIFRNVAGNEVGTFFHADLVLNFFSKKGHLLLDPVGPLNGLGDGRLQGGANRAFEFLDVHTFE